MSIQLLFACGHQTAVDEHDDVQPICLTCGDHRIQRVQARPPRFRGACRGPHAVEDHEAARPHAVKLATQPLRLKDVRDAQSTRNVV